MPISVVSRLTGMTSRAIRYYEEHALITTRRDRRGVRFFDADTVARLEFIAHARRAGLSVAQVLELLATGDRDGELQRAALARQLLNARLAELDAQRAVIERSLDALGLDGARRRLAS